MAGIYIHIPFCRKACTYCNFHFSTSLRQKDEMLTAILEEINLRRNFFQGGEKIETIYFGGGTPSLLSADELNRIFERLHDTFHIGQLREVTLEANPDDLDRNYLRELRSTPVSRISVGVQSFRDEDLLYMNRAHNAQQSDYAIKAAQDAGLSNMSIDLIYGTPGLSDIAWKQNLETFRALEIPHLSSYGLTVEEGTALHHNIEKKKATPVDAAQSAAQFMQLMEWAASNGYVHYEISNLSKPGMYAVHNTNYWRGKSYLGIGPSAHSFRGEERSWNISNNSVYLKNILAAKTLPQEIETLSEKDRLNEYIMTSLRTKWGLNLKKVAIRFGAHYAAALFLEAEKLIDEGKAMQQHATIVLTNEGKLFADAIAGDLFF